MGDAAAFLELGVRKVILDCRVRAALADEPVLERAGELLELVGEVVYHHRLDHLVEAVHDEDDALVERVGLVVSGLVLENGDQSAALELSDALGGVDLVLDSHCEEFGVCCECGFEQLVADLVEARRLGVLGLRQCALDIFLRN